MACAQCGAEKGHFFDCPLGGMAALPQAPSPAPLPADDDLVSDEDRSTFARARRFALPLALGAAFLLVNVGPVGFVMHVVFAMWLHEFGHAVCSWLCGAWAFPLPWVTLTSGERSVFLVLVELAGLAYLLWRWRARAWPAAVVLVALVVGLLLPAKKMEAFIVFGGDGGALVLGTLFMLTVFLPDSARLSRGALRWGFLVIGAGAFAVVSRQWFAAWRDPAEIPFGMNEGVGLSDATRLVDQLGWTETGLVRAYLSLSALCLVVLASALTASFLRAKRPA